MSVCLSVSLSGCVVCVCVCVSACLFVCLSVGLSVCMHVCTCVSLNVAMFTEDIQSQQDVSSSNKDEESQQHRTEDCHWVDYVTKMRHK